MKKMAAVCVIGQTVRRQLFPDKPNPVGEWVRLPPLRLRVVGVLGEKGRAPTSADQDNQIFMPLTTFQREVVGEAHTSLILATTRSQEVLEQAKEEITRILRQQHHLKPNVPMILTSAPFARWRSWPRF
jgi:putative ABC transport system permease protein